MTSLLGGYGIDVLIGFEFARFDDLARYPDEDISVPDSRHAMFGCRLDEDRNLTHLEIDRTDSL